MKTITTPKAGERTHTPGPWRSRKNGDVSTSDEDFESETVIAHTALGNGIDILERENNARLLAAAPDLLKILDEYIAAVDAYYRNPGTDDTGEKCAELVLVHERAIAIIAKAETPR